MDVAKIPYFTRHQRTGMWIFRRPVPKALQGYFGDQFYASLKVKDRDEAIKLWRVEFDESQRKLDLATAGEWPPLEDEAMQVIISAWIAQADFPNGGIEHGESSRGAGFDSEDQLIRSLTAYIAIHHREIKIAGPTFERIKREAIAEHDDTFGGYTGDVERKRMARDKVRRMDPEQVLGELNRPAPVPVPVYVNGDPFADLSPDARKPFMDHLDDFIARNGIDEKNAKSYRKAFQRLNAIVPNKATALVNTLDIEAFYQSLVATRSDKGDGTLKYATIYRSISHVRTFYNWAVARHLAADNPCRKIIVDNADEDSARDKRQPYSIDDLKLIFNAPLFTGCKSNGRLHQPGTVKVRDHRFWFPLVALYTGMRPSEMKQLEFDDIIPVNERPHFSVNRVSRHGHNKKTKTESSIRQIPLHFMLINIGFLRWVEARRKVARDGRIFPAYTYGKFWNETFTVKLGIKSSKKAFYSLRHNMRDALRNASESDEAKDRITGHWSEGTGAVYGGRDLAPLESEIIDRVTYPGLNLTHLIPNPVARPSQQPAFACGTGYTQASDPLSGT